MLDLMKMRQVNLCGCVITFFFFMNVILYTGLDPLNQSVFVTVNSSLMRHITTL